MKLLRKQKFTALVCENMDEQDVALTMIRTDSHKQPLTEIEKSRGIQRSLLLGVDPVEVDKATKGKGQAKRVKRTMDKIGDIAEDMTLDRMVVIDEFSDDPDVVEKLINCDEKSWRIVADNAVVNARPNRKWQPLKRL